jgi:8-oxo-dGTP pyrophosphatase MutT (NUDIX family)
MYLKIFFSDKPLFLCDEVDEHVQEYLHHDDAVFIDELNSHTVKSMIHEMELPKVHAGVFFHPDLEVLKKAFYKKYTVILAGGGLVMNEKKEVLLIHRRGKWDLPKGKLDEGENIEQCALREVEEETGLKNVILNKPLTITYHTYHEGARSILKESHWFLMEVNGEQELKPQYEEDIQEVKWVKPSQLKNYFEEAFPSVVDVLRKIS